MITTSAVSMFQDWLQKLDLQYNTRICHLLHSPSLILMSYLFQYLKLSRFLTAKVISFQLRILKTSMKNLILQEDLAEFPNYSHRLVWMTWWGILIYRKNSTELLASRLKERNLLAPGTVVSFYPNRERDLVQFFRMETLCLWWYQLSFEC